MSDQSSTFDLNAQYPEYIGRTGTLESGWNPHNVTGSNRGLFQWGPPEERMYGITNWLDRGQQISALNQEAGRNYKALNSALGQPPTGSQLYLAHQQGLGGARALLTAAPDQPAWMAVRPFYKSDAVAQRAISGNIPSNHYLFGSDPSKVSAADFRGLWDARYNRTPYEPSVVVGNYPPPGGPSGVGAGLGGLVASSAPGGILAMMRGTGGALASAAPPAAGEPPPPAAPPAPSQQGQGNPLAGLGAQLAQQPELEPAPMMQLSPMAPPAPMMMPPTTPPLTPQTAMATRLANIIGARGGGLPGGRPMPPTVAQRIAALMGRGVV